MPATIINVGARTLVQAYPIRMLSGTACHKAAELGLNVPQLQQTADGRHSVEDPLSCYSTLYSYPKTVSTPYYSIQLPRADISIQTYP